MSSISQPAVGELDAFLRQKPRRLRASLRLARANPVGMVAAIILLALIFGAVFADYVAPHRPTATVGGRLEGPSTDFWLGTDRLGRDVLSRMLHGARVSLYIGFVSVGLGTLAGTVIGLLTGYIGGWIDLIVQRLMDILMAIPILLLALVLVASLGTGERNTIIAIAVVFVPITARVMRSVVLQVKSRTYIEAARATGATDTRLLWRHIVPNAIDEVLILASVALGAAIIIEASLSFLGLGVQIPNPSWGTMLAEGRETFEIAQHMVWVPAAAISITVLSVTMIGDTLRDILDPKVRGGPSNFS